MVGLLGKKLGQTRVYDEQGAAIHVTVVLAGPNHVLGVRTPDVHGYSAVQLGFEPQKKHRVTKPLLGQFEKAKVAPVKRVREFRDFTKDVKPGDQVSVDLFQVGDYVDAIGVTKGRGFEGVMKRHNFRGGDASHGAKGFRRRPGAIGQRLFPGHVNKGMKMPGHMGQVRRTTQNLQVVQVRPDDHLLLIKGSVPGARGDYVIIREAKKIPLELAAKKREEAKKAREEAEKAKKAKSGAKGKK